jgi:pyruvate,water dikinase
MGTSRLLAISSPQQVATLSESFFLGNYDMLKPAPQDASEAFHLITGNWKTSKPGVEARVLQDGSEFGSWISTGVSQAMTHVMGNRYQELLDNLGAYYYFPPAIAKESSLSDGTVQVRVKPISGHIDQAGGIAFAVRDWGNYFVFRINALEDNLILFEFRNGRRLERLKVVTPIRAGRWYQLRVETTGNLIRAFLDDRPVMEYQASQTLNMEKMK